MEGENDSLQNLDKKKVLMNTLTGYNIHTIFLRIAPYYELKWNQMQILFHFIFFVWFWATPTVARTHSWFGAQVSLLAVLSWTIWYAVCGICVCHVQYKRTTLSTTTPVLNAIIIRITEKYILYKYNIHQCMLTR